MAVVGEASVRIVGNLKPLSDSLAQAKKMVEGFDKALINVSKNTQKSIKAIEKINPKVDYSGITKMNIALDNTIRRVDKLKGIKIGVTATGTGLGDIPRQADNATNAIDRFRSTVSRLALLTASYLGVREIKEYADTWTRLGNQLAAASEISGIQARSLKDLNVLANQSRSGIEETAGLYARMLRSTKGVAKSELEVAQATDTVNKAFKAGGAAASEQAAGIMQLGQALGSGFLQGDELRSLRENAPVIAQAIADEFGTTIAGLKELGAEGKLTSDRVFKAILNAQKNIDAAFGTTSSTISEGITRVKNAFIEYVGSSDQTLGATAVINKVLNMLADNFGKVADMVLNFAAVIAGALVGRSLTLMIGSLGKASGSLLNFTSSLGKATSAAGAATSFGALATSIAPLAGLIGSVAAVAFSHYVTSSIEAEQKTADLVKELQSLGYMAKSVPQDIDKTTKSLDKLTGSDRVRKIREIRAELEKVKNGTWFDNWFSDDESIKPIDNVVRSITRLRTTAGLLSGSVNILDNEQIDKVAKLNEEFKSSQISAEKFTSELDKIKQTNVSQPIVDLIDKLQESIAFATGSELALAALGDNPALERANQQVDQLNSHLDKLQNIGSISEALRSDIDLLIEKAKSGQLSAEDLEKAINNLSNANPNLSGFFEKLQTAITIMQSAINKAREMQVAIAGAATSNKSERDDKEAFNAAKERNAEKQAAADYVAASLRRSGLNKKELAEETALAKIRKDALADNIKLTAEQEKQLVAAELAGKASRTAEGKKPKKEKAVKLNDYEKEVRSTEERIDLMRTELAVQQMINPTLNDYGFLSAKAETAQKLLSDAKRAGLAVGKEGITVEQLLKGEISSLTPEAREQALAIIALADTYGLLTAEGGRLSEQQKIIKADYEALKEASRSSLSGFVSDILKGKSALDSLADALSKVADALITSGLQSLFGSSGSGGFGLIGSLFGFDEGGYTGDGGKNEAKGVVHGGEYVFSKAATQRLGVGNLEAMHSKAKKGYANGGLVSGVSVPNSGLSSRAGSLSSGSSNSGGGETYAPVYNFSGTSEEFDKFKQYVLERDKQFNARAVNAVQKGAKKNVGF